MGQDALAAERVDEGGSAYTAWSEVIESGEDQWLLVLGGLGRRHGSRGDDLGYRLRQRGLETADGMTRARVVPVPEAPQTIKQNWIPFFTFFFRRIIFWERIMATR